MKAETFFENVKICVQKRLGSAFIVKRSRVLKNNGVFFNGLIIGRVGISVCPTIYLDSYYSQFCCGRAIEQIVEDILLYYQEVVMYQEEQKVDLSFETVQSRIVYRLVNYEKNRLLLKDCPMLPFLDLAITFHVMMDAVSDADQASMRVTNNMMEMWGVDTSALAACAEKNTCRLLPPEIYTISQMMEKIFSQYIEDKAGQAGSTKEWDNIRAEFEEMEKRPSRVEMYVITNKQNLNGAAAILYKELVQKLAERFEDDLYLLPSSIHEFIAIPAEKKLSCAELEDMVRSVNRTQLPQEEFLSDYVYYFRRMENKFERLS